MIKDASVSYVLAYHTRDPGSSPGDDNEKRDMFKEKS